MQPLVGVRVVNKRGGPRAPMFMHAEEDVDARSNQTGCCQLRSEVRGGLFSDCIFLIVQSKDDMSCVLEMFN